MKTFSLISLRTLILSIAVSVSGQAATLYVATSGSDSATGAQNAPLASLSRALALVKAGDTIFLGTGTFTGDVDTRVAGTATNRIVIEGSGVGSTIYTGELIVDMDYYTVRNITFRGNSVTFKAVTGGIMESCEAYRGLNNVKVNGGSNCIVRNNYFHHSADNGMTNISGTGHLIEGNTFRYNNGNDTCRANNAINCIWRGNYYEGLSSPNNNVTTSTSAIAISPGLKTFLVGSGLDYQVDTYMRIVSSSKSANYMRGWVKEYSGSSLTIEVTTTGGSGTHSNWKIESHSEGNHADVVQAFTFDSYGNIFENNRLKDCSTQLGNFSQDGNPNVRDWIFRNNVFWNSRIQINVYAPGFKFYNNTVYNSPGTTGFRGAQSATAGNGSPILVYNNIFCRVGTIESGGPYSGAVADYNLITDYADDSSKKGFTEANGINGGYTPEQIFVNPAGGDFRLKAGSPAIRAGVDLSKVAGFLSVVSKHTAAMLDMGASDTLIIDDSIPALVPPSNIRVSSVVQ